MLKWATAESYVWLKLLYKIAWNIRNMFADSGLLQSLAIISIHYNNNIFSKTNNIHIYNNKQDSSYN